VELTVQKAVSYPAQHCYADDSGAALYGSLSHARREQARAELAAAIEFHRPMGMTFWLPQAEAALARIE